MSNLVLITWSQAKQSGLRHFFTGKPCPQGHIAPRYVGGRECVACGKLRRQQWSATNREHENERMRRQRKKFPEASRAATRKWRANNSDRWRASYSKYRLNNLKKARKAARKWAAQNRPAIRAIAHARRVRERHAEGRFSADDIERIRQQQRKRCAYCRALLKGNEFHIDHIKPIARGGTNWPNNLQLLCKSCNAKKWKIDPVEFARRQGMLL